MHRRLLELFMHTPGLSEYRAKEPKEPEDERGGNNPWNTIRIQSSQ